MKKSELRKIIREEIHKLLEQPDRRERMKAAYHAERKKKNITFKVGQEVAPAKWGDQRYPAAGRVAKIIEPGPQGKVQVKWVTGQTDEVNTNELIGISRGSK
jgi:hypothetical protein